MDAREAFQRWPPSDRTCLKETLLETTSVKAKRSGYHFSNGLYPGNAYINHCISKMPGKKQKSIIPLTHTLRERSAILLYVCSMYIEHCCSVDLFGDTFIYLFFDTFMFLKCIQQIILFE